MLLRNERAKLYGLLQEAVDKEIQQVGFVPDQVYGFHAAGNGNGAGNGSSSNRRRGQFHNGNGQHYQSSNGHSRAHYGNGDRWHCTDGQRGFILRIVNENQMDKQEVEDLAQQLYQLGVKQLNKMQEGRASCCSLH